MPARRNSIPYSSTGIPVYEALSDVQEDLRLILYDVRGNTHGIAVDNPRLQEALRKASKLHGPILSNPLPSPSQVCFLRPTTRRCSFVFVTVGALSCTPGTNGFNVNASSFPIRLAQTEKELLDKELSKDYFTAALLRGVQPVDGLGAGTPFITAGDGNRLFLFAKKPRGMRNEIESLAVKLRPRVTLEGMRHMEAYLPCQEEFFMCRSNYGDEVREGLPN
ncbi:unnamed protein product [Ectocarpus sp. CCAP 1310/34]|nr:unnamed protein product [Ectocarpus sp. CCAP 1310/34]